MAFMTKKTYGERLLDPRWQKKKNSTLERDNYTCQLCGDTKATLHVHHFSYHGEPWDVPDFQLITFCDACHLLAEEYKMKHVCDCILKVIKRKCTDYDILFAITKFNTDYGVSIYKYCKYKIYYESVLTLQMIEDIDALRDLIIGLQTEIS